MRPLTATAILWATLSGSPLARAEQLDIEGPFLAAPAAGTELDAALRLFDLGPSARSTIPALVEMLQSHRSQVRLLAIATLAEIGPDAESAAFALAGCLDDPVEGIQPAAIEALQAIGPASTVALIETIKFGSPTARANASLAIEAFEHDTKPRIPVLVATLEEEDLPQPDVATGGVSGLPLGQVLLLLRNTESDYVRYRALSALGLHGERAEAAVPVLIAALRDTDAAPSLRMVAAWSLARIGTPSKPAEPDLIALVRCDPFLFVRAHAAQALGRIGAAPRTTVPVLMGGLRAEQGMLRGACAASLWRFGPHAAPAVTALKHVLADPSSDAYSRYVAAGALGAIGEDAAPAVAELAGSLFDLRPEVRFSAAYALGRVGPAGKSATAALRVVARDADEMVRMAAQRSLRKLE